MKAKKYSGLTDTDYKAGTLIIDSGTVYMKTAVAEAEEQERIDLSP